MDLKTRDGHGHSYNMEITIDCAYLRHSAWQYLVQLSTFLNLTAGLPENNVRITTRSLQHRDVQDLGSQLQGRYRAHLLESLSSLPGTTYMIFSSSIVGYKFTSIISSLHERFRSLLLIPVFIKSKDHCMHARASFDYIIHLDLMIHVVNLIAYNSVRFIQKYYSSFR